MQRDNDLRYTLNTYYFHLFRALFYTLCYYTLVSLVLCCPRHGTLFLLGHKFSVIAWKFVSIIDIWYKTIL